jgi:hypothetical protein
MTWPYGGASLPGGACPLQVGLPPGFEQFAPRCITTVAKPGRQLHAPSSEFVRREIGCRQTIDARNIDAVVYLFGLDVTQASTFRRSVELGSERIYDVAFREDGVGDLQSGGLHLGHLGREKPER